jgi:gas vesicle protein
MFKSRKDDQKDLVKKFAVGAAITAVAGYVAGVLTAPKSGKDTRKDIKNKATETYVSAEKELKKVHTELSDVIEEVGDRINSFKNRKDVTGALEGARGAKQKAREVLSSLHDGETNDKELKKAISDATKAVEHLREFLRK